MVGNKNTLPPYINLNGPATKTRYQTPILNGAGNKNTLPNPYINFGLNGGQQKHVTHPTRNGTFINTIARKTRKNSVLSVSFRG